MIEYSVGVVTVIGDNCAIKRKGKLIKLTDDRESNLKDLDRPKIQDGDVFIAGKGSAFTISSNPDPWKPYDKNKRQRTKFFTLYPGSELKVGVDTWRGKDTADQSIVCTNITNAELSKGMIVVSSDGCDDDPIVTPVATVIPKGNTTVCIDLQPSALYVFKGMGSFETKSKSGKSYLAKGKFQEEVIVTGGSIYLKPLTKMDASPVGPIIAPIGGRGIYKDSKEMAAKQTETMQNMGSIMDQASVAMEMMKRLSPEQVAAMSGGMTAEQKKQFAEGMEQFKKMQKSGKLDEAQKAMAIGRAQIEGMGQDNIAKFQDLSMRGIDRAKEASKDLDELVRKAEGPRNYAPVTAEFKVA